MVNYGVSRACKTCKLRRKKCDETRPSCQKCAKAKRTCLGYHDDTDLHFRRYRGAPRSFDSPLSGSFNEPTQTVSSLVPTGTTDIEIESYALADFFNDYCLVPTYCPISRGYLEGLETLLAAAGPSSDVSEAANIVALANIGTKLRRASLVHKARIRYSKMLHSLQVMISKAGMANATETLVTAVLLGLYEIITATETHPSNHSSHFYGIHAVLSTENSPIDLLNWASRFQRSNNPPDLFFKGPIKTQAVDIFRTPGAQNLDALVIKACPLFHTAEKLLASTSTLVDDLQQILKNTRSLNKEISKWPGSQIEEWRPRTLGFISPKRGQFTNSVGLSRVDTYLDLYVAAVWNTYRKVRLMILNVIIRCSKRLEERNGYHDEKFQFDELSNDMVASIPFHLCQDIAKFMIQVETDIYSAITPGKSLGGLLLMHPLFVTSSLAVTSPQLQDSLKNCLSWIGTNMGIGEATLLSKTSMTFPNKSVVNGYAIIWAAMLFTTIEKSI